MAILAIVCSAAGHKKKKIEDYYGFLCGFNGIRAFQRQ
jgi:hypothetical protein